MDSSSFSADIAQNVDFVKGVNRPLFGSNVELHLVLVRKTIIAEVDCSQDDRDEARHSKI